MAETPYPKIRKFGTARGAITAVFVAALLLVVFVGDSIDRTGQEMPPGTARDVVIAVGKPAGSVARALPFASAFDAVEGWFKSDDSKGKGGGGVAGGKVVITGAGNARVAPEEFDRRTVQQPGAAPKLSSLLVTGDSMSMPLDAHLARALAPHGVKVVRDPRVGSGISKVFPVDWIDLAKEQGATNHAQVVVVLLGANEGFPLPWKGQDADCCTAKWAAAYANRVRGMVDGWIEGGAEHVLWLALPGPKDPRRQPITRAVNAAVRAALARYGARAAVLPTDELFTPGGAWRSVMFVDGREQIVRRGDGIHLNDTGAELAAQEVQTQLRAMYTLSK